MTLLRSKAMRVILSDNGSIADQTESARTWGLPSISHDWVAAEDALFIGRAHKFQNFYVAIAAAGSGTATMTAEYWNGSAWVAFSAFLDESAGFSASGFLQWEERPEWVKAAPDAVTGLTGAGFDTQLFWVRLKLSGNRTGLGIRAAIRLLSDDRLMASVFPEIMGYLPSGQTDFLPQHELAMQTIVQELTAAGRIQYAEQLKNVEDWLVPATYKTVELILDPIVGDENLRKVKEDMRKKYDATLLLAGGSLDSNKDEDLDASEEDFPNFASIDVVRR